MFEGLVIALLINILWMLYQLTPEAQQRRQERAARLWERAGERARQRSLARQQRELRKYFGSDLALEGRVIAISVVAFIGFILLGWITHV